jgi:hypothetical protein
MRQMPQEIRASRAAILVGIGHAHCLKNSVENLAALFIQGRGARRPIP